MAALQLVFFLCAGQVITGVSSRLRRENLLDFAPEDSEGKASYSLAEVQRRPHRPVETATWADELLKKFKASEAAPAAAPHRLRVKTDAIGLHRHKTEEVLEASDQPTEEKKEVSHNMDHADLGYNTAHDAQQFHWNRTSHDQGEVDADDMSDEEYAKEDEEDIRNNMHHQHEDDDEDDDDDDDDDDEDVQTTTAQTTTTTDMNATQKFRDLGAQLSKFKQENAKAHPQAPAHIKAATKQHMIDEGEVTFLPVAFHPENGCGERIPAKSMGLSLSQHAASIWQSPSLIQTAEHPGRSSFAKPGSGGEQVLKDEGMSQPGMINGAFPFVTVLKDGYYEVGCFQDAMLVSGDKFGNGADQYKMQSSGVSIALYKELVLKELQVAMTPRACFEFCRTVPDMGFFGITNGRDCYCTPYYKPAPGNSDACDSPCEGDPAVMCGNQQKSTIWEMHLCDDTAEDLGKAMTEAKEALDFYFEQAGLSMDLGRLMQEGGEALEKAVGAAGVPSAADMAMSCKRGAKDLEQTYERGLKFYKKLLYTYQDAKTLKDGDFSSAAHATAADRATAKMKELSGTVIVESQRMFEMVKAAHPLVFKLIDEEPEPTDYAAVALTKDDGFKDMYQHASVASDSMFPPGLSTCSGPIIGGPLVGISAAECGKVCTATDYPEKCVAFSYYTLDASDKDKPRDLCLLLSDVTSLTTFDCSEDVFDDSGCLPKMRQVPADVCTPSSICMIKGSEIAAGFKPKGWDKAPRCFGKPEKHDGGLRGYELPDEDSKVVRDFMKNFDDRTTTTTTTTTITTTTVMVSSMRGCKSYETSLNDQGGRRGKTIYFDRHTVQCPAGAVLSGWKLSRGGTHDKIKFVYNCCDLEEGVLGDCSAEETNLNDDGGGKSRSHYLDRHNVKCKEGSAMTGWHLDRAGTNNKYKIKYNCCKMGKMGEHETKMGKCETKKTKKNDDLEDNAQCGNDQIMTRWKLKRTKGGKRIYFKYKCCSAPKIPQYPGGGFVDPDPDFRP